MYSALTKKTKYLINSVYWRSNLTRYINFGTVKSKSQKSDTPASANKTKYLIISVYWRSNLKCYINLERLNRVSVHLLGTFNPRQTLAQISKLYNLSTCPIRPKECSDQSKTPIRCRPRISRTTNESPPSTTPRCIQVSGLAWRANY